MRCPKCGYPHAREGEVCRSCGVKVAVEPEVRIEAEPIMEEKPTRKAKRGGKR